MTVSVTPERFAQIEALFQRARRLSAAQRAVLLNEACAGDAWLRGEVEGLLARDRDGGGDFMAESVLGDGFNIATAQSQIGPRAMPHRVGGYTVVRVLGEGGMGMVYQAEQDGTRRAVALKIIRAAAASPQALRRFEQEGLVLGRLRHPGIAQVYEAGVHADEAGAIPFIAMEIVVGAPITQFCSERSMGVPARLQLFAAVCDAVQHAHARGVIHRDIKPANILVEEIDGQPQPKILDFGIARVTDADVRATVVHTSAGELIGTLQYMSPEQASGNPARIDARTDVYALGVLLWELLAGRPPYDLAHSSVPDAVRVIRDTDAPPLTSASRSFRGDLNTILGKALEKDQTRRYPSAAALADDLRRFLRDEPITAHPPTALYQARKFARRHRALVTGAAAVFAVLTAGIILTSWQAVAANRARQAEHEQRQQAERRLADVRRLANVFLFEFDDRISHLAGALPARELIVKTGLEYLDRLAAESDDNPRLQQELAAGYVKLGDVQGDPGVSNFGDTAGALASYGKAIAILEPLIREYPAQAERTLVHARIKFADVAALTDRAGEALPQLQEALVLADSIVAREPGNIGARDELGTLLSRLSACYRVVGRTDEALQMLRRAETLMQQGPRIDAADTLSRRNRAVPAFQMGMFHLEAGRHAEALEQFEKFAATIQAIVDDNPHDLVLLIDAATGWERTGDELAALGRKEEALQRYRRALAMLEAAENDAPNDARLLGALAVESCRIGEVLLGMDRREEAAAMFERYLAAASTRAITDSGNAAAQRDLAVAQFKMGQVRAAAGADAALSAVQRQSMWSEARTRFGLARDTFVAMRQHGLLRESDAGAIDEVSAEIARCDAALAEFQDR